METLVEGEWNGFEFRRARPSDESEINELLHANYFPKDAMVTALKEPNYEDYEADYKKLWVSFLNENLSFLAVDIATNKIAGLRINHEFRRGMNLLKKFNLNSRHMTLVAMAKKQNLIKANLFEKYNIDKYAALIIACVAQEFRQRGLATEMYKRSLNLLRAKGYFLATSSFNSPYSRKASQNLGFVEVARTYYVDLKDDLGNKLIPQAGSECASQGIYFL